MLIIDSGKIVAQGTPEELRRRGAGAAMVRATFTGELDARPVLSSIAGVRAIHQSSDSGETRVRLECDEGVDCREDVFRKAVANGWTLRELVGETATLEDVFVRLTTQDHSAPETVEPEEAVS